MGLQFRFSVFILVFIGLFAFQNCGEGFSSKGTELLNSQSQTSMAFSKGDPYDPTLLPYEITDQASIDQANDYVNRSGMKAIAFTEDGELFFTGHANINGLVQTQEEWNRVTLERCQLFSMNKACSLYAEGDVIAQNEDDFYNGFVRPIIVPQTFDGNLVPGKVDYWRNFDAQDYPDFSSTPFKAYAVGPYGMGMTGWSQVDQAEADRRALENCEVTGGRPCTLYAQAMNVIFDLDNYQWGPVRVIYAPAIFNVNTIPIITESLRDNILTDYSQSVNTNQHFVLALDRFGTHARQIFPNPPTPTEIQAVVDLCTSRLSAAAQMTRTCFLYSVDDQIVMTRQSLTDSY